MDASVLPATEADGERQAMPCAIVTIWQAKGSTPREVGAWMRVTPRSIEGTIGGGEAERRAIEAARTLLSDGTLRTVLELPLGPTLDQCCGGHMTVAIARLDALPPRPFDLWQGGPRIAEPAADPVYLYGGGHVGLALAAALAPLPFAMTWIDGRHESAWPAPPQSAQRRLAVPEQAVAEAPDDAIHLVMTHSHALDLEICAAALARPFRFLGLIGSQTKRALFCRRLTERGLDPSRLTSPIGLAAIPGKAPAVIAASVAAQLLSLPPRELT